MPTETIEGAGPMVKMVVANGRTIQTGNSTKMVGEGDHRFPIEIAGEFIVGAGQEIELPRDEAERLHAAGFLVHPGEPQTRPAPRRSDPEAIGLIDSRVS